MNKSGNDTRGARSDTHPGSSRALPWVTVGVLLASLLATLAGPAASDLQSPRSALRVAALLWSRHAYLAAEPEVLIEVGRGLSPSARRERLASMRELAADAPDDDERAELQAELDAATEQALGGAPHLARTAWIPAHPHVVGLLAHPLLQRDLLAWLAALAAVGVVGVALERALGWRFLLAAVALGWLGPALFLSALLPGSELALRGSSALAATLLGVAMVRFWSSGAAVPTPFWDGAALRLRTVVLPLRGLAFICLLEQLLCVARAGFAEHVYQASIGGLALGAGAAILAQRYLLPAQLEARAAPAAEPDGAPLLEQARKARARGESSVALALLRQAVRDHPDDAEVVVELWEAARSCGRPDVGLPRMLALVQRSVARSELSPAARYWLRLREVDPRVQLPPESAIPLAFALARLREGRAALETLRGAFEDPGARISGALALQAVEIAAALEDEALVQQAARAGLALPYLSAEIRQRLESFAGKPDEPLPAPRSAAASDPCVEAPPARETERPRREIVEHAEDAPEPEPDSAAQVVQPQPEPADAPAAPVRRIAILEGAPDRLGERGLSLRLADRTLELAYERIQAIAVAGLPSHDAAEPLVIFDLVLNWNAPVSEPLHVIRVRSDRFDPRLLVGDALGPGEASRVFLHELHTNTRAVPLPDGPSAEARPLRLYASLADYEREVLRVSR